MQRPYEYHLDYATLHKLRDIHFRSHWPALCRRTLLEYLKQEEPRFSMNGKEFSSSDINPLFRELVNKYYMSFLGDCVDEINVAGVVFFRFRRAPSGDSVPVVIRSEHFGDGYEILIKDVDGANRYRVLKRKNKAGMKVTAREMKQVMVMDHFGGAPTHRGVLRSRLVGLLEHEIYYQYMLRFSLQAEYILSNPPIVTETPPEAAGSLPVEERETDYYTPHEYELAKQQGLYRKDAETVTRVQKHQRTEAWSVPLRLGQVADPVNKNVHPIPMGLKVISQAMPVRNARFSEVERVYELKVCSTYGIPRSLLVQDVSMQTAGAYTLVKDNLKVTLGYWNHVGGQLLTAVYRCIYYPEDCNWIVNNFPGKEKMSEKELYKQASKIADVSVILPIGPHGSVEQNYELWNQGVITWNEYVKAARGINGFGHKEMPEPEKTPSKSKEQPGKDTEEKVEHRDQVDHLDEREEA